MSNEGKKVNWKKRRWLGSIGLLGLLLLFSHQNCAPAGGVSSVSSTAAALSATGSTSQIQLTDEGESSAALSFSSASAVLTEGALQNNVVGVCSPQQQGALLAWDVQPVETGGSLGAQVLNGYATCTSGTFTVALGASSQLTCGVSYRLTAQLGVASPGVITVSVPCP
jgi:hypothetical protein